MKLTKIKCCSALVIASLFLGSFFYFLGEGQLFGTHENAFGKCMAIFFYYVGATTVYDIFWRPSYKNHPFDAVNFFRPNIYWWILGIIVIFGIGASRFEFFWPW